MKTGTFTSWGSALALAGYFAAASPCTAAHAAQHWMDAPELAKLLRRMDAWPVGSVQYTAEGWNNLIAAAKVLQRSDPQSVRIAMRDCQQAAGLSFVDQITTDGKLFLLMRAAFELPERATVSQAVTYTGWKTGGTELNGDLTINLSWPLAWNGGHPQLVASFDGARDYRARYDAAREFTVFLNRFPMRRL